MAFLMQGFASVELFDVWVCYLGGRANLVLNNNRIV